MKRDRNVLLTQLGAAVERRRRELGLGQVQLAERWDSDRSQVSRLENGWVDPKASDLVRLGQALETTVAELLDEDRGLLEERARLTFEDPALADCLVRLGKARRRMSDHQWERVQRILTALADLYDPLPQSEE
jgi:transcriptional regulator with XRE-family HTH domain